MMLIQIYIPNEVARDVTFALGDVGNLHIVDQNKEITAFQRTFVKEIRKLEIISQHLKYLQTQVRNTNELDITHHVILPRPTNATEMETLSTTISNHQIRVKELADSHIEMENRKSKLLETREIIKKARSFFENRTIQEQANRISTDDLDESPLLVEQDNLEAGINLSNLAEVSLNYVVGSIPSSKIAILQKILFRTLRGNLFMTDLPIEETFTDKNGDKVSKSVFIVYTHGSTLLAKAKKIIDALDGRIIEVTSDPEVYDQEVTTINSQVSDLANVIAQTKEILHTELYVVAEQIDEWKVRFKREKSLYTALNKFKQASRGLIAEAWIPRSDFETVKTELRNIEGASATMVQEIHTNKSPPTFHRTNKFSAAFQAIVDAYGIATYQEVNPGLATIVTFPFMFAIMFGDLGHGFILFLIAFFLVLAEKKLKNVKKDEIFAMAYDGRYILLLMGVFSMYTGLLYNDVFSKSMTLFKSGWEFPTDFQEGTTVEATKVGVYKLGLDFAWHGTENNLIFTNSYKMKLSILMGYAHMTYSFFFSLVNYKFRRSAIDIKGNFLPGLIFMQSIFGYLSFAIIFKWCFDWKDSPAPGLLNMLINMFLSPGKVDGQLFKGQAFVQVILLLSALICVPILLLYKPLKMRKLNKKAQDEGFKSLDHKDYENMVRDFDADERSAMYISQFEEPGEFEFGDVMIHQVIHTIEFCLNCVSHTASYLRLWALSLAHAQLSTVLWSMTIANAFSSDSPGSFKQVSKVVILFGMWFVLTVCILVLMEGTSAMLHSLRLHWVEAMSKYFEGEGYAYEPFKLVSFDTDLAVDDGDENND
ncbi:hypothetical protein WICMUC_005496 [Wickerhamomyces mucosus]|uniref:V-type proton ATPase subunit a n=1 Tax=Wickerhamomyces mucosus TaxID=1378264 RepID=A0A9P8T5T3_9ASCO|nr:hypothetical protein WICMUC_005496 [Wickerhamomyces mucosus]